MEVGRPFLLFKGSAQAQTASLNFGGANTAGNCIIVYIAAFNTGGGSIATVTDTQGQHVYEDRATLVGAGEDYSETWIAKKHHRGAG